MQYSKICAFGITVCLAFLFGLQALQADRYAYASAGEEVGYAMSAAESTPKPGATLPVLEGTPPALWPEPVRERRPSLVTGAALVVGVVLLGLLINYRRTKEH